MAKTKKNTNNKEAKISDIVTEKILAAQIALKERKHVRHAKKTLQRVKKRIAKRSKCVAELLQQAPSTTFTQEITQLNKLLSRDEIKLKKVQQEIPVEFTSSFEGILPSSESSTLACNRAASTSAAVSSCYESNMPREGNESISSLISSNSEVVPNSVCATNSITPEAVNGKVRKKATRYPVEKSKFANSDWVAEGPSLKYSAEELCNMYKCDKKPTIAKQNKKGGQCGYQAYALLLWSIPSIGATHPFASIAAIRSRMITTVETILKERATYRMNPMQWYHPGDIDLLDFSVHAFRTMPQVFRPVLGDTKHTPLRFVSMRNSSTGRLYDSTWLLRQEKGYFILYGNREVPPPEESAAKGKTKFENSWHFLGVNIPKRLILDNKTEDSHSKLCKAVLDKKLPYVVEILRLEKLDAKEWKIEF